jgi:uncharacterized membrane protein
VPLSNYAGWFLVAFTTITIYQLLERRAWSPAGVRHVRWAGLLEPLVYLGIVAFNLTITVWIGESFLALVGAMLYAPVVVLFLSHPLNPMRRASSAEVARHRRDFPASAVVEPGAVTWRTS